MHGVRDLQARDAGRPFVGPAGRLLDEALIDAGLDRRQLYITNVVKHFKWKAKEGTRRRIHDRPLQDEVEACRPWFQQELSLIRPRLIICLGATAATAVLGAPGGRPLRARARPGLTRRRGRARHRAPLGNPTHSNPRDPPTGDAPPRRRSASGDAPRRPRRITDPW
jgi:uracil-DNA glycosylase family 4